MAGGLGNSCSVAGNLLSALPWHVREKDKEIEEEEEEEERKRGREVGEGKDGVAWLTGRLKPFSYVIRSGHIFSLPKSMWEEWHALFEGHGRTMKFNATIFHKEDQSSWPLPG